MLNAFVLSLRFRRRLAHRPRLARHRVAVDPLRLASVVDQLPIKKHGGGVQPQPCALLVSRKGPSSVPVLVARRSRRDSLPVAADPEVPRGLNWNDLHPARLAQPVRCKVFSMKFSCNAIVRNELANP